MSKQEEREDGLSTKGGIFFFFFFSVFRPYPQLAPCSPFHNVWTNRHQGISGWRKVIDSSSFKVKMMTKASCLNKLSRCCSDAHLTVERKYVTAKLTPLACLIIFINCFVLTSARLKLKIGIVIRFPTIPVMQSLPIGMRANLWSSTPLLRL